MSRRPQPEDSWSSQRLRPSFFSRIARHTSLRLFFLLLVVAALAAVVSVGFPIIRHLDSGDQSKSDLVLAQLASQLIDDKCTTIETTLRHWTDLVQQQAVANGKGGSDPIKPALPADPSKIFGATWVGFFDVDGNLLRSIGSPPHQRQIQELISLNESNGGVFLESGTLPESFIISVSGAKHGDDMRVIGLASYRVQVLQKWLGPLWNDRRRSTYVIDGKSRLILASHSRLATGTSLSEYGPAQRALNRSGTTEYKAPDSNVSQLVSYSEASVPGWAVLLFRPSAPSLGFGDLSETLAYLLIIAAVLVAVVVLLSLLFQSRRGDKATPAPLQPPRVPGRTFSPRPSTDYEKSRAAVALEPSAGSSYRHNDWAKRPEGQSKKPSDTVQKMAKPDSQTPPSTAVQQGLWKCTALSVKGTSHQKSGTPCQDASYCRIVGGKILVGAVADGAGSASHSELGSRIAVRKAVETVAEHVESCQVVDDDAQWKRLLLSAMDVARGNVEASAAGQNQPTRQLATTLILFAATPDLVVAAQIGDGAIVLQDARGQIQGLTSPQSGEYINTTTFLVSPDAFRNVQENIWRGSCMNIAVFTDGLQMLALTMPEGTPHPQFFAPLFGFLENHSVEETLVEVGKFLQSDKITNRADDDLTLMLAANVK